MKRAYNFNAGPSAMPEDVLKEAQAKCTGEGLRGHPNQTQFLLTDPRVRQLEGCLVAILTEGETYAV